MQDRAIALIGLSGTGKSTVGRALAERTGMPLIDTDRAIERQQGQIISALFEQHGEAHFRTLEQAALAEALGGAPAVVATGGGIVLRPANRALLRELALVVWLDAPTEELVARLATHDEERPLLSGEARAKLDALRAARAALYAEVAHHQIITSGRAASEIAQEILRIYRP